MYTRYAFFRGRVQIGRERDFSVFVADRLLPLWRRFPGVENVEVLRQVGADPGAPQLEMVLAMQFPDIQSIDIALASEIRAESRKVTAELMSMFEGDIFHVIFKGEQYSPLAL